MLIGGASLATSMIDRYWIGGAAWSKSHVMGKTTGAVDAAAAGGVLGPVELMELEGGGRVNERSLREPTHHTTRRE